MPEGDLAERCCPVLALGAKAVEQHRELRAADLVNQPMVGSTAMASSRDTRPDGWSRPVLLTPSIRLQLGSLPQGQQDGGKFSWGTWQLLKLHIILHKSFALKVHMLS